MPTDLSPTARALRTLEILQSRPGTTAGELARRLGVTERAARRYITILREAGLPAVAALEENLGTGREFPTRVVFDAPPAAVGPVDPPGHGAARTSSKLDGGGAVDGVTASRAIQKDGADGP